MTTSSQDMCYISLLGLAEHFRTSNPPNIKKCIQCLQALFTFKPPAKVEARTHLQLGQILITHTTNVDMARNHLEQAVCLWRTIICVPDECYPDDDFVLSISFSGSCARTWPPSMMLNSRPLAYWPMCISRRRRCACPKPLRFCGKPSSCPSTTSIGTVNYSFSFR